MVVLEVAYGWSRASSSAPDGRLSISAIPRWRPRMRGLMQADPARCSVSSDICRCAAIPISARLARDPTCEGLAVKFLGSTGHQRLIRDVRDVSATHPIAPIWHKAAASCEPLLLSHWHRLVDALKRIERRVGQGGSGSCNSAKLYNAFFIGDRRHRINYFL